MNDQFMPGINAPGDAPKEETIESRCDALEAHVLQLESQIERMLLRITQQSTVIKALVARVDLEKVVKAEIEERKAADARHGSPKTVYVAIRQVKGDVPYSRTPELI